MKTGILITARLGSSRLKRKHLLGVNNIPILLYLTQRILHEFKQEISLGKIKLIITTSDEPDNREFEKFANNEVIIFYGSKNNIPLRHLQTARAHELDNIISIDGDDILCSVKGMRSVYDLLVKEAKYVKTSNLPFGMNSFGYTKAFLESSINSHINDVLETGWGRIFNAGELVDIDFPFGVQNNLLRFTLDYKEDFNLFNNVIEALGEDIYTATDEKIVELVITKKLYKINESISKNYWDNFYNNMEEEKRISIKALTTN